MKVSTLSSAALFSLLVLALVPTMAQANAGTPLMLFEAGHMVLGNALIGLLEGTILVLVFKLRWVRTISLMILANYVSAWVGTIWVLNWGSPRFDLDIQTAWGFVWRMVAFTFVWTLVLEFPFVLLAFSWKATALVKAFLGNLLVQSISYSLLVFFYFRFCATSLYSDCQIVSLDEMDPPVGVRISFISREDGKLHQGELNERHWKTGNGLPWQSPDDHVLGHIPNIRSEKLPMLTFQGSSWSFTIGDWYNEGLRGQNSETGEQVKLAFETPFAAWVVTNATHLPGDFVLLQLDNDQICLFDPVKKQIALVARGHGPTAILRKPH